ncbi:heparinase II/III domain-containing protein [Mobilicoccus pelagius]|uniref:Heparinase II/III-like C-terminal domain-containing protein n=1 Tax=Mobilicoccus pelagius NBRC 104925 TaxID=1089455 RepID=H5UUF6_9MICO|nr:heparinase II/III family protein [Mobilicoccus pelagius]GAB49364.1 hypothetical protein MOPEL_129_00070 [Mobilicoccus pelagius NBRC 104925]
MSPRRASVALLAVGATVLTPLAVPAGPAAAERTVPDSARVEARWAAARCGGASTTPVLDSRRTTVTLPPARPYVVGSIPWSRWQRPDSSDPTWQMRFYSLEWMKPIAKRAHDDGQRQVLRRLVSQVESFYRANPDKGRSTLGWDEGTSLRRLGTLSCVSVLTGDPRLEKRMAGEVGLLFGPRYYGPPRHPVHNHGLMANMNIKVAGEVVGRRDWVRAADQRMRRESALAFTKAGTSHEQSAWYHLVNTTMWRAVGERMKDANPKDATAREILARTAKADVVGRWLTEPDGDLVQIGDTARGPGMAPRGTERPGVFRDDQAGLLVGRWSWKDPSTTYYTVRYGPPRFAHGHPDKGAVTWSTAGARVLVGPGYYSYEWKDPFASYARTAQAHNVARPVRGKENVRAAATLRHERARNGVHAWNVDDRVHGVAHRRGVRVDDKARTLTVTDGYPRGVALQQSWHLDPSWSLVGRTGNTLTFRDRAGRTLRMTTTGRVVSADRGRTRPVAGWNYPATGRRVPAWEVTTGGTGTVRTTFTIR